MGDLQAIGYSGQPRRETFRSVRPGQPVLVDLSTLFPRQPHSAGDGKYQPGGLQMTRVVTGELTCWARCEWGQWWGLVTYPVGFGARTKTVTHWIPAWHLKPENPAQSAPSGRPPIQGGRPR